MNKRTFLAAACSAIATAAVPAATAYAQADYPDKPIRVIMPWAAGGPTDVVGRLIAVQMGEILGQPLVIETRAGASGNIGARAVAEAPADGHTLLMVNSSFAINPGVYSNLGFSPKEDFAAVINVAFVPSVYVVPAVSPWRSLDDALAAATPDRPLPFASCGNGTP
ncbi:ABC transporter substrate-binding protein, partial [Achromobacter xylosoxidans]